MDIPFWYIGLPIGIGAVIGLGIVAAVLWRWPLLPAEPRDGGKG